MLVQLLSMANRKPDPNLANVPTDPRNQQAVGILFLAILPLGFSMLDEPSATNLLTCGGLFLFFGGGLYAISQGLKAAEAYDAAPVTRRPKYPFKIIGCALLALGAALTVTLRGGDAVQILLLTLITGALALASFGLDPLRDKGLDTVQDRQRHTADLKSHAAMGRVSEIKKRVAPLGCADIMPPLLRFEDAVEKMCQAVQDDPERARSLQKHLGVYLDGAVEASQRFAALYRGTGDVQAHARFVKLLHDLATAYEKKVHDYLAQGRSKFDVQIDVLSESLARDTARTP